ncbi:MAG: hypothetical protein PVG11_05005, partial [Anaerolineae bacterium]
MTLMSQLGMLESAGLIRVAQVEPDVQYLFRHALVQDAAYASLLDTDQRRLHRAVGHAVETLYPDRLDEYAPMLARHFREAGEYQHAVTYFSRAGITALAAYANEEAESHFRNALELERDSAPPGRAVLLAGLGEALFRQSRYDEAIAAWDEAIERHCATGDLAGVARLYARSARAMWHTGDYAAGLDICVEGLAAVEGAPESAELAALLHETGRAYYFNRQPEEARPLCERALELAARLGAVPVQADTLATLGVLPDTPPDEAVANLRRAVELADTATGDGRSRETSMRSHHKLSILLATQGNTGLLEISVRSHHNLGITLKGTGGDLDAATRHLLRAAELARQRGAASEEIYSLSVAIGLILDRGDMGQVEHLMRRMEALASGIPETGATAGILPSIQATLLQWRGQWAEALRLRRQVYAAVHRQGDYQGMAESTTELAWSLVEMERLGEFDGEEAAAAALDEAAAFLQSIVDSGEGKHVIVFWAHCQLAMI